MLKSEAVERWGANVVEEACDYYETDFDKYLFQEDCPEGGWCASDEDQMERCTRASRNLALDGPIDPAMGPDTRYGVEHFERYKTRRSVTHEYVYGMPVAAYREKRQDISPEELEFLRGNPGYAYSEHWSTPSFRYRAERLFSEHDLSYMLEHVLYDLMHQQYEAGDDGIKIGIQRGIDSILRILS